MRIIIKVLAVLALLLITPLVYTTACWDFAGTTGLYGVEAGPTYYWGTISLVATWFFLKANYDLFINKNVGFGSPARKKARIIYGVTFLAIIIVFLTVLFRTA